jgi:Phosphoenolpyruvate synthase/pyruvate phosphate dikinase
VSGVVQLEDARDDSLFGSKAVGLGEATRAGLPLPPGVALSGAMVDAVAAAMSRPSRRSEAGAPARWTARRALVGGRRGRGGSELRRSASDAAQRSVGRRCERGFEGGLVVGQLRLGDQLPAARRSFHAPERRCRRPNAPRSPQRRRDVHP